MSDETERGTSWRRLALGSFLTLLLVAAAWNVVAYLIDASALAGPEDGWGVLFGSAIGTVIYGSVPMILALVAVLVAAFGPPGAARAGAWIVALLTALCGVGLLLVFALTIRGTPAELAFGLTSLLLGLVLLAPVVRCVRKARSEHGGDGENQAAGRTQLA